MRYLLEFLLYAMNGYILSSFLVLILSLFVERLKVILKPYLEISNRVGVIVIWIFLLLYAGKFIYDNFIISDHENHSMFVRYKVPFLMLVIFLKGFPSLLFLKKKFRNNITVTLTVIVGLVTSFFTETIYQILFLSAKDTLPSSWSYYISYFELIGLPMISALVYFGVVLLLVKRKAALQQPSL